MANSLGEIAVALTLNTAQFISGFGEAGVASKKFRSELSDSIEGIGGALEGVLNKFGEFGAVLGETLAGATAAASSAITAFGKLGGTIGTIAGVGAGAAAAILSVDAGAIGLAIHTAETAARLGEMAQKAGVSSETLAGLGLAGEKVGVDVETVTKALGFLNSNMVKAAIAPEGTKTAFSRMGIAVKDAAGQMRDTGAVFLDVIDKVSSLPAPEQGYVLKQLLGRGGIELLPLINQGVNNIKNNIEEAKGLGLGDADTIANAQRFKEAVVDIHASFEGLTGHLTTALLPALLAVGNALGEGLADQRSNLNSFIDGVVLLTKSSIAFADLFVIGFEAISKAVGVVITEFVDFAAAMDTFQRKTVSGDFAGAFKGLSDGVSLAKADAKQGFEDLIKIGVDGAKFMDTVFHGPKRVGPQPDAGDVERFSKAGSHTPPGQFDLGASGQKESMLDRMRDQIKLLAEQAAGELALAAASNQSVAAQKLLRAENEADQTIAKLLVEADKAKAVEKPKLVAFINQERDAIHLLNAEKQVGKDLAEINTALAKETLAYQDQINSVKALGAAYQQGGAAMATAIASADIGTKLAKDKELVAQAREEFSRLAQTAGISGAALVEAARGVVQANTALAEHREQLQSIASAGLTTELFKETGAFIALKPSVDALSDAYLKNEQAVRAARIELELHRFEVEQQQKGINPATTFVTVKTGGGGTETVSLLEQKRRLLVDTDVQAHSLAINQASDQFNLNLLYSDEIKKLEQIREALISKGAATLLVDAAEFDAQEKALHQWDQAAIKVGTFGERVQAVFGELVIQGNNAGAQITQGFLTAIDSVETQFAKLATGQKANFKQIFQNLGETIAKSEIQRTVGSIAGKLGVNLPTGQPDGSTADKA
jgi:hypothetical protein